MTREQALSRVRMIDLMLNANPQAGLGWRVNLDEERIFLVKHFDLKKEELR